MTRKNGTSDSPTERAVTIASRTLNGEYDPLLACRDLANLRGLLPSIPDQLLDVFVGIASEVDDLPIGSERSNWSAEALRRKDHEAAVYRERTRGTVEVSLEKVLAALGASRQAN